MRTLLLSLSMAIAAALAWPAMAQTGAVVAGTAPTQVIDIFKQGTIAVGTYPLIDYDGTIGGLGFAGLQRFERGLQVFSKRGSGRHFWNGAAKQ